MTEEQFLWGLIPTVAASLSSLISIRAAITAHRPIHYLVTATVHALTVWSLVILYRIFIQGAWPTFLPHIAIGLAVILATVQFTLGKAK